VSATGHCADAARDAGAAFVVVSTDWVFDGTQGGADEATPPNPVNLYGVLNVASEVVALERGGAVARVSGVNGLRRGERFTVWESDDINMRSTPSLASESADLILRIGEHGLRGVFHCCGGEAMGRMELARLACDVFELDSSLLDSGPPDPSAMPDAPIPYDTSITAPRTSRLLDHEPSSVRDLLLRFRREYEAAA
jgi:dTDP-4-dehydrorhamnose reductase